MGIKAARQDVGLLGLRLKQARAGGAMVPDGRSDKGETLGATIYLPYHAISVIPGVA